MPEYRLLNVSEIKEPPLPVRALIDETGLAALADSIRQVGLLQPIIVIPDGPAYEIVAGHRRFLACRLAGQLTLPAMVYPSEGIAKEAAKLHENLFREDLTPADEALFFAELIEKYDLTEAALCQMVRHTPAYIYGRLDLLKGDRTILEALQRREIVYSVALELNRCPEEAHRRYLLEQAVSSGATAKVVFHWVQAWKMAQVREPSPVPETPGAAPALGPVENPLHCFICGGDRDPYNLVSVYVHTWEKEKIQQALRQAVGA